MINELTYFVEDGCLFRFGEIIFEFAKQLPQQKEHDYSEVTYRHNLIEISMLFARQNPETYLEAGEDLEDIIEKWIKENPIVIKEKLSLNI